MKIIDNFAMIRDMSKIQSNTIAPKLPARFTRSPWLRNFAAATIGLTAGTTGYMATDAVSGGMASA